MTPDVLYDQMIGMGAARRLGFAFVADAADLPFAVMRG
jgi:hypothetical protein